MAITKPNLTRIWAADAAGSDVVDPDVQTPGKFSLGWGAEKPPYQFFNFMQKLFTQGLGYFDEQGIGFWNTDTDYQNFSITKGSNGSLYFLKASGDGTEDPVDDAGVNWTSLPTRAEVDAKADQSTTYTETEVDGLLNTKANQATTYTETEVDDLIATRAVSPGETAITGTATFTNSTNNIALTGIGSIGLEIGDVVQVTGTASNNKLFTVEVITDTNNLIVNAAHAGGTTTKSLVDETVAVDVSLLVKWFQAPIGLGQGWVSFTSVQRPINTNYANAANRVMQFAMVLIGGESSSITVNDIVVGAGNNGANNISSQPIVPVGGTYKTVTSFNSLAELR